MFAEYYYGTLSRLAHANGLELLVEPYGTGNAKPFNPIDTDLVISQLNPSDPVAAEFWTRPLSWGWPEVPGIVASARRGGRQTVYAEGFTCVPGYAWKDDQSTLKVIGDRAFCLGINAFMLHAGAQNPWVGVVPGMTFGMWGTEWTPGQTWWKDGGKALFGYFTRCQTLLRKGVFVDDHTSTTPSLHTDDARVHWIHRREADTDFYFVANTADQAVIPAFSFTLQGRVPEIWNPQTAEIHDADAWLAIDGKTLILQKLEPRESLFIVFRRQAGGAGPGLNAEPMSKESVRELTGPWDVSFPEGWGAPASVTLDRLVSWTESDDEGIRYFSGTATYSTTFTLGKPDRNGRYLLDLGNVKNLAVVRVNGQPAGTLWTPPFRTDITNLVHKGQNTLEIEVTNLWLNRMIRDEFEPEDIQWTEPTRAGRGRQMLQVPDWLANGQPRPSQNRKTVVIYKTVTKDDTLLDSGLLGPVRLHYISQPGTHHQ